MAEVSAFTAFISANEDILSCAVCHKDVENALLLPCLHSVCQKCVNKGSNKGELSDLCPVCSESTQHGEWQPDYFIRGLREFAETVNPDVRKSCDYCSFSGYKKTASERCLDCCDNMCSQCAEAHRKTKLTRNHLMANFVDIGNGKHDSTLRESQYIACKNHHTEAVKFQCNKCKLLVCTECKVSRHHQHSCSELPDASQKFENAAKPLLSNITTQLQQLDEYSEFLTDYHTYVEKSKTDAVREIEHRAEVLHKVIDQYRQSLIDRLMPQVLQEQEVIEQRRRCLDTQMTSLRQAVTYIDHLFSLGTPSEILHSSGLVNKRLSQLSHVSPEPMKTKLTIKFKTGKPLVGRSNIANDIFGTIDIRNAPLQQEHVQEISTSKSFDLSTAMPMFGETVQLVKKFTCQSSADIKEIWPSGIAIDLSENMLIVDKNNKRVKVFDRDGTLLREFGHNGAGVLITPYDIAVLYNGNVAVSDVEDESIKIFNHMGDFITRWKKDFKYPRGIATNPENQLLVVDSELNRVTIHNPDNGLVLGTISGKTADRCNLFNDAYYITTNTNGYTIVTDWVSPHIKIFDKSQKYLSKYGTYGVNKDRMLQPYGVCTDALGYIFVADNQNHRIHLLGPDGKFKRFLVHEKHGLWHPMAMTINKEGHLVITEALGDVKIFKYF